MRLEQFEAILETAKQKSMQKAAESLYTSTQNISKLIKDFEKELHIQIFTRTHTGVFLTEDGKYIVNELEKVTDILTKLKSTYSNDNSTLPDTNSQNIDRIHILSVPSESTVTSLLLEHLSKKFTLQNALIDINDAMLVLDYLENDCITLFSNYDLIFLNLLDSQLNLIQNKCSNVPIFSLYKNRLGVHINRNSVEPYKKNISVKDLYQLPLVAYIPDNHETTLPLMALKNLGVSFTPHYIVRSEKICQNFIQNNMGFSFVPFVNDPRQPENPLFQDNTIVLPLKEKLYISHALVINPELVEQSYYLRILNFLKKQYKYMKQL